MADLIDEYLPAYDYSHRNHLDMGAPADRIFQELKKLDLKRSRPARWLFRLRGLPAGTLTLDGMRELGFNPLAERPGEELVIGVVGRFWLREPELVELAPEAFKDFHRDGFAKVAWNFKVEPRAGGAVRVTTETRVLALGRKARRRFRMYWLVIAPFSSFLRREMLRIVKRDAEKIGRVGA